MWDRQLGQLFVLDTMEHLREKRCRAVALAWRQLLTACGWPFSFEVYAPFVGWQAGGWECG